MTLWDLHWLKELDDEGFIDELVAAYPERHSGLRLIQACRFDFWLFA